jgi:RPE1 domain-containing protein
MDIYTTSQARVSLFKLVENANITHNPVYIVGKRNKAVLISEEDYRAMIETLYITSIAGMKDSIIAASKEPLESYSESIDWDNKPLQKLAYNEEMQGAAERRTGVYSSVHEDSSTGVTQQLPLEVEFPKRFNA